MCLHSLLPEREVTQAREGQALEKYSSPKLQLLYPECVPHPTPWDPYLPFHRP